MIKPDIIVLLFIVIRIPYCCIVIVIIYISSSTINDKRILKWNLFYGRLHKHIKICMFDGNEMIIK